MKNRLLLITTIAMALTAYAETDCDVILTSENFQIPCVITHISESEIQYGECPTSIDSVFTIPISNVKKIYMYNGVVLNYADDNVPKILENIGRTITVDSMYFSKSTDPTQIPNVEKPKEQSSLEVIVNAEDLSKEANNESKLDTTLTLKTVNQENKEEDDISLQVKNTFVESSYALSEIEIKQKSLAEVQKYVGVYIFNDNEPICEYKVIERIKVGMSWSSQYEGVRNHLVNKALKKYPQADAIILNLSDGGIDRATIIKFSNPEEKKKWGYAKVNSFNGLYVFSDCIPVNSYTIIGRSKSAITWSGQYGSVKANLIKHALKSVPNGQGIILNMHRGGVDRGVVIVF